ncbi:MAG: RluA family pseudouridine synthase [Deltaproteobacteria bacterium]|jgi:23S rRNA pseudouridine1911/1915/1917 synthase|nr:RluA family pseudouridine synthase [Deltaproteobacteria bacterium]
MSGTKTENSLSVRQPPGHPESASRAPLELTIDERQAGRRLDAVLTELCPQSSRSSIAKSIRTGSASLDGLPAKPSQAARVGQRLVFAPPAPEDDLPVTAPDSPVEVIYQDEEILVINKPPGLTVHPGAGHQGPTLAGALLALDPGLARAGPPSRPGLVHRLDKDTSGVMVVARTPEVLEFLTKEFADRRVEKRYLAFVRGQIPDRGRIDSPIGRHPTLRHKMRAGSPEGRPAVSLYNVVRKFPQTGTSLAAVDLLTGRTHQARVHLASLGAPVLADPVYGRGSGPLVKKHPPLAPFLTRQFLHARRLTIRHPSGLKMTFRAPWPDDFVNLLRELLRLEKLEN